MEREKDGLDEMLERAENEVLYEDVKNLLEEVKKFGMRECLSKLKTIYITCENLSYVTYDKFDKIDWRPSMIEAFNSDKIVFQNLILNENIKKVNHSLKSTLDNEHDMEGSIDEYVNVAIRFINMILSTSESEKHFEEEVFQEFFGLVYKVLKFSAIYSSSLQDNLVLEINRNANIAVIINEKMKNDIEMLKRLKCSNDNGFNGLVRNYLLSDNFLGYNRKVNKDLLNSLVTCYSESNVRWINVQLETKVNRLSGSVEELDDETHKYIDKIKEKNYFKNGINEIKKRSKTKWIAFLLSCSLTLGVGLKGADVLNSIKTDLYPDRSVSEENIDIKIHTILSSIIAILISLLPKVGAFNLACRINELKKELEENNSNIENIIKELDKMLNDLKQRDANNLELVDEIQKLQIELETLKFCLYLDYDKTTSDEASEVISKSKKLHKMIYN